MHPTFGCMSNLVINDFLGSVMSYCDILMLCCLWIQQVGKRGVNGVDLTPLTCVFN